MLPQISRIILFSAALALTLPQVAFAENPRIAPRAAVDPATSEVRTGLIIGNSAYKNSPLKNPANDARDMASALRTCGFSVIEQTDCDLEGMEKAIEEFGNEIKGRGVALFYYAGHAVQANGSNYLVPVGAGVIVESEVRQRCVDAGLVLAKMENAGNRANIVILDACRSNPFARSWQTQSHGLAMMAPAEGTIVAYATAPGRVAANGDGRNSVYTAGLLRHIRTPGLQVENLFKRVRADVMQQTKKDQIPWENSSLVGDFYFVPGARTTSITTVPSVTIPLPGKRRKAGRDFTEDIGGGLTLDMVWIDGATFEMGSLTSESKRDDSEGPVHAVALDGFWMGKFEVTQEQYECLTNKNPSHFKGSRNPVENVSWHDATFFCNKLSQRTGKQFRLPTEAQWEYACRGGTTTAYFWGNTFELGKCNADNKEGGAEDGNVSTFREKGLPVSSTMPVGTFDGNAFGLHNMHGNVWEWCADWYDAGYYENSPRENPGGPSNGTSRVLRGGSWGNYPWLCRSALRYWCNPSLSYNRNGFRVVCVSRTPR